MIGITAAGSRQTETKKIMVRISKKTKAKKKAGQYWKY